MRPFLAQCRECQLPERRMHDMIVAAMQENRAIIKAHIERMVTIFEAIIREGTEAGELKVEDRQKRPVRSTPRSRRSSTRF